MTFLRPFAGWMTSARLETLAANAERLLGRGLRCCRRTIESRIGSFGNRGNGRYREELRKGIAAIGRYLATHQFSQERTLLRLDGQYGNGAVLSDVAGFAFVTRGKDYRLLDHPLIRVRLHLPPDQVKPRPERKTRVQPLRLPRDPGGTRGTPLPRSRRNPSSFEEEESSRCHTCRYCLRTVLYEPAKAGVYRSRCRRIVPASRSLRTCTLRRRQRTGPRQVVQPFGLLTGVLADGVSMGLEPQIGIGAPVGTNAAAHHRIRSCFLGNS
jgi:hypothetical protein